jgi:hypothetical protein
VVGWRSFIEPPVHDDVIRRAVELESSGWRGRRFEAGDHLQRSAINIKASDVDQVASSRGF